MLTPPAGTACSGDVQVTVKAGTRTVTTRRARVGRTCAWSLRLRFANRRRLGRTGRLTLRARYLGTAALLPRSAKAITVRTR